MSRLKELIQEYCPDGVKYRKLSEVTVRLKGSKITAGQMKTMIVPDGPVRIFAGGQTQIDTDYEHVQGMSLINEPSVLVKSRGIIDVVYYDKPYTFKQEMWAYKGNDYLDTKFLYYFLTTQINRLQDAGSGMGSMPQIKLSDTDNLEIPIPPLPVQQEIVRILDSYTKSEQDLEKQLEQELELRKKQYKYYENSLMKFDESVKYVTLDTLFPNIRNGFVGVIKPYFTDKENGVRYLEGTNIHNGIISDNEELYVTKEFHQKHIKNELKPDDILMVQSGHIGECAVVGEKYAGSNCHALIIMSNGGHCNSKFYTYYFHSIVGFKSLVLAMTGGTVKHVLANKVKKIKVPFPSIEQQNYVVSVLDNFNSICTDLTSGLPSEISLRKKQYEYYRDNLLNFKRIDISRKR